MKPVKQVRLRKPALSDGELKIYWGKETPKDCPDIIFAWQGDATMKRDSGLLYYHLCCERPDPNVQPLFSKMLPSLTKELEERGYDLSTLRFSIKKKEKP